jgi:UDP-N-acetylmuramate: L-alanyl-gamma-D-glutamyl-meso-diaminopimelate ligase
VLQGRWTIAVAGTHGKTTTSSMIAWVLERAGLDPGFLIGGVPGNFEQSARLGRGAHFVVEADEYDTAFFDKRAKFVHYRPRTAVLNNLEFDHADIYPDIQSIQRQFHLLMRIVPAGLVVCNAAEPRLLEVLEMGCWTPRESFSALRAPGADWSARLDSADGSSFCVLFRGETVGHVSWPLIGLHNVDNALAALAAARHAGVEPADAAAALCGFGGVRRRMELRGTVAGIAVYDDFAHHPTAISSTLDGLRKRADLGWDLDAVARQIGPHASVADQVDRLASALAAELQPGDHALIMSNGSFEDLHAKLLTALGERHAA